MKRTALVAVVVVVTAIAGCPKKGGASQAADAGGPPRAATVDAGAPGTADDASAHEDIQPVYDANTPPTPAAVALCDALYTAPAERKAACCKDKPGPSPLARTCAGVLSAALAGKAVTLDEAKAKSCADARARQTEGCAWVGPIPPRTPPECSGLLRGSLDGGAVCRSSLECKDGLRCLGVSPLDTGRCGKPAAAGGRCGGAVDALSIVMPQVDIDREHPSCDRSTCELGVCRAPKNAGDACQANIECGDGNRCDAGKCAAGRIAAGKPCTRGGCVDGARCANGTCTALNNAGEPCSVDFDCALGGCAKDPGKAQGVCGMRCSALP